MTIERKNGPSQPQAAPTPGTAGPNINMNPNAKPADGNTPESQSRQGMRRINDVLRRNATSERSEARVAEALKTMNAATQDALSSQVMMVEPTFLRFDRQQQNRLMSAVLAIMSYNVGGVTTVAVRPLLLESSDAPLPKKQRNVGNMREELQMRAQDVYDTEYWKRVTDFVREQIKVPDANVIDAGVLLIPEKVKVKDRTLGFDFDDQEAVKELVIQTSNRLEDALATVKHEAPINLSSLMNDGDRLRVKVDTDDDLVDFDTVGNPIRSDMRITMKIAGAGGGQNGLGGDGYLTETELNQVSAFVDFEYTKREQAPMQQMAMGQGYVPPKPFTPVIVATNVRNASWIQASTMELYMLAISNLYRCLNGMSWAQTRNPKFTGQDPKGKETNIRDIAALGYLATNPPTKPNLLSSDAGDQDFIDFMNLAVEHTPAFAIDIDPVGENIALESCFMVAASSSEYQQRAKDYIIKACDNLTNGHFSKHFNGSDPIIVATGTEMHLGRYLDNHGEVRDLRDLDTVAALNLSKGNIAEFRNWYMTRLNLEGTGETFEGAMRKREQIERTYLSNSLTINRRAPRYIFTQTFLDALDAATNAAGAHVEMSELTGLSGDQFMGNTMIGNYTAAGAPRTSGMGPSNGSGYNYGHPGLGGYVPGNSGNRY